MNKPSRNINGMPEELIVLLEEAEDSSNDFSCGTTIEDLRSSLNEERILGKYILVETFRAKNDINIRNKNIRSAEIGTWKKVPNSNEE
jgi:hypothetical protein